VSKGERRGNGFLCVEKRGEENIYAFWFEDLYYRKANRRLYNANFRTKIHVVFSPLHFIHKKNSFFLLQVPFRPIYFSNYLL
jgi:hypothetical protein